MSEPLVFKTPARKALGLAALLALAVLPCGAVAALANGGNNRGLKRDERWATKKCNTWPDCGHIAKRSFG
jgi:hypothetical protein